MTETRRGHGGATDLTQGRPIVRILVFSIPLILGTLVQQAYSFADSIVVGRLISDTALGAVGATYPLNFLVLGFIQGACIGFSIPAAQRFGAKDAAGFKRYVTNGAWLCAIMAVAFTLVMSLAARPLLMWMATPEKQLDMAWAYILVTFLGIPSIVLYNHSAALLRAVGDSRHPFVFLTVSCAINVVCDVTFITVFHMGVVGSALGNVIGQTIAAGLNVWWAFAKVPAFRIGRGDLAWSGAHVRRLCAVGLPMGLEYSVSALGAIAMQHAINALGAAMVTAQTTGEKIRQLFTLPMESVGMAMATYAGQNFGARRFDRIRRGLVDGVIIQAVYCLVSWVVIALFKEPLCRLVLGDVNPGILDAATQYLFITSCFFILHGALMITRNTVQGMGHSTQAIISGVGELAGRFVGSWISLAGVGYLAVCLSNPLAWGLALAYCVLIIAMLLRRYESAGESLV